MVLFAKNKLLCHKNVCIQENTKLLNIKRSTWIYNEFTIKENDWLASLKQHSIQSHNNAEEKAFSIVIQIVCLDYIVNLKFIMKYVTVLNEPLIFTCANIIW